MVRCARLSAVSIRLESLSWMAASQQTVRSHPRGDVARGVSADPGAKSVPHPARKAGFSTFESGCRRETDSPLEGGGLEPSVPRSGHRRLGRLICCSREFPRCRLFRLSGAEVLRRNSGRIGGFEKGEFERDSARKEVAAQICVRRADTVQLRAQEIDEPTKIRIVVQRDPLRVYEVVRQRLRRAGGPIEIQPF